MKPVLKMPQPSRHPHPTVRACRLAHLIFERPDLELAERFLTDFGLVTALKTDDTLYLRGTGPAPYCYRVHRGPRASLVGFGLCVPTETDLIKISQLPGASPIEACDDPGGGQRCCLTDPSGFVVEAVYRQAEAPVLERRSPLTFNDGAEPKRVNATQRPPAKPSEIIKLGHIVIEVAEYQKTCEWYSRTFGFIPSDVQVLPDGSPLMTFMRLDLGDQPADHHTMGIAQGFMPAYSHSAYEVVDADAVGMGQRILRNADGTMPGGSDGTFSAVKSSIIGKTPGVTNTNITATAMRLPPKRKWELGGLIRRPWHSGGNACRQASAGPS